jgi:hypothetical protein
VIENRLFVVAIVTAYESKAELIREKAQERDLQAHVRVVAYETLGPFLSVSQSEPESDG